MSIFLILFFVSLAAIILMVGRKLLVLQSEVSYAEDSEEILLKIPYMEEASHLTIKNAKKVGYAGLVGTLRLYIRSMNMLKARYKDLKSAAKRIKMRGKDMSEEELMQAREANKFLRMITDYKRKIREIKYKIHEEEKNL